MRIDESELEKRLKINRTKLREQLTFLEQYGVADINLQSNLPKITLLTERMPEGYLTIANSVYTNRKKIEEGKLEAMIRYLTESKCRQEMISVYFDTEGSKCGKCDVCMAEKASNHSFKELLEIVPTLLPANFEAIVNNLNLDRDLTQRVLHSLLLEEKIVSENGQFRLC